MNSKGPRIGVFPCHLWQKASTTLKLEDLCVLAYLWTCSHRRTEGIFRLPVAYIAGDLSISLDEAQERLNSLNNSPYVYYQEGVIFLSGYMPVQNTLRGKIAHDTAVGIVNGLIETGAPPYILACWEREVREIPKLWESLEQNGYRSVEKGGEKQHTLVGTQYVPGGTGYGNGNTSKGCPIESSTFVYFKDEYKNRTGKEHPGIAPREKECINEALEGIRRQILGNTEDTEDTEDIAEIIDQFFRDWESGELKSKDPTIWLFTNPAVWRFRALKVGALSEEDVFDKEGRVILE